MTIALYRTNCGRFFTPRCFIHIGLQIGGTINNEKHKHFYMIVVYITMHKRYICASLCLARQLMAQQIHARIHIQTRKLRKIIVILREKAKNKSEKFFE